jgi:hypothetical protein
MASHAIHQIGASVSPDKQRPAPASQKPASVHPVAIEIGVAAILWFLTMTWLSFGWGRETDLELAVVTLFCVIFFTLFLSQAYRAAKDPRWQLRHESFKAFLHDDNIAIDRGCGDAMC